MGRVRKGPSDLGDECQRCLADKLTGQFDDGRGGTPLAPLIGTAVHALFEQRIEGVCEDLADSEGDNVADLPWTEMRLEVDLPEPLGTVKGVVDLYDPVHKHAIDWKILGKQKIKRLRSVLWVDGTGQVHFDESSPVLEDALRYYRQTQVYGYMLNATGHPCERLSLALVPRDATTDTLADVVEVEFPYDADTAERVIKRAVEIKRWAESHPDLLDELPSSAGCYHCKYKRPEPSLLAGRE